MKNILKKLIGETSKFAVGDDHNNSDIDYYLHETYEPIASYRLAEKLNIEEKPLHAKELFYKAFSLKPDICRWVLQANHPNHKYLFPGIRPEEKQDYCPLCGGKDGLPHWCYSLMDLKAQYVQRFNPVRLWMRCEACNHLYAEEFPKNEPSITSPSHNKSDYAMKTNISMFRYYSEILNKLYEITKGKELLEIGIGGSECALIAQELGYNVFGIDISNENVQQALRYGIKAEVHDFVLFEPRQKWDIIILGDVLEHVSDPIHTIQKLQSILNKNGAIWISTPNFESAVATVRGHNDQMRRVANHRNYFSRHSLYRLLERLNFRPIDYQISTHYNGSMEVIAVKGSVSTPNN